MLKKNITDELREEYDNFLKELRSNIPPSHKNSPEEFKRNALHRQRLAYELGIADTSVTRHLFAKIEEFNLGSARFYYYCLARLGMDTAPLIRLVDEILLVTVSKKKGIYEKISEHGSLLREAYALALGDVKKFSEMTGVCPVSTLMYMRGKYKVQSPAILHGLVSISKQVIADQKQRIASGDGTAALYVGRLAKRAHFQYAENKIE